MEAIWEYTEYRSFLKDWIEKSKRENPFLSYRYILGKTGIDPGLLSKILSREKHLSDIQINKILELLKLSPEEETYFRQMYVYGKSRRDEDIRLHFEKLLKLRNLNIHEIESHQLIYYSKWYYPALRNLVGIVRPQTSFSEIGASLRPVISGSEAEEGVKTLVRIGLIRKASDGGYEPCGSFLSTGDKWKSFAIREHQKHLAEMGHNAIDGFTPEEREISTLTIAIPHEEIPTLREMVREFRRAVLKWTGVQIHCDHVMQMNLQVFPIAKVLPQNRFSKVES
jgi:uncharacterized protein (TIGR02147 family)